MEKQKELYSGKAKTLFATDDPDYLVIEFRDDASAFDGKKLATLAHKGAVNNRFNAFIMEHLAAAGIPTHFEKMLSPNSALVKHLRMFPIECVVRNVAAGSLCRRLGIESGRALSPVIFEFFLKNDPLHDPMINESHILTFEWADQAAIDAMKTLTINVNDVLTPLFADAGMTLVDYKLEFGRFHDQIVLGDEFTPDGCRIWAADTQESLDKDRFRQDLGDVIESYQIAADRLGVPIDK